ncbi:MAG: hypothetical protein LC650_03570, partial [Actinobacteria bacterium]|nr:hypothetical protein [Actinomycetota bacterium]
NPLTVNFTGTSPWNLTYSDGTTPVSVTGITANPYTFNVTPSSSRTYTITALSDAHCDAQPADLTGNAVVTVNPRPTSAISGSNTICEGESAQLSIALTGAQPWSLTYSDGVSSVTVNDILSSPYTFNASPASTRTYTVTNLSDAYCSGMSGDLSGNATITVNPRPTALISGTTTICEGNEAQISITLTGTQPWSVTYSDGTNSVSANNITTSPYTFEVYPISTTTYTLTALSDAYCTPGATDMSGAATLTVYPRPTAVISGNNTICEGSSTPISVTLTGTSPWNLTYSDGTTPVSVTGITANTYTFNVTPNSSRTYTITALSDAHCDAQPADLTGNVTITVNQPVDIIVQPTNTQTVCSGTEVSFTVTASGSGLNYM